METNPHILEIERELETAVAAERQGKGGLSRVCARRAVGAALRWYLEGRPRPAWGEDVVAQLKNVAADQAFPPGVREAARRLSDRVTQDFRYPGGSPIDDARLIISHFINLSGGADAR